MSTHIPHLDVGSGRQRGALTLFPIWVDQPSIRGIEWSTAALEISELPEGPSVEQLSVVNGQAKPVLLIEGDLLEGGMQHRMMRASTVLAPHHRSNVDVFCVEQGRWSGERRHHAAGGRATNAARRGGAQQTVWQRVERYQGDGLLSPTSSMLDHLARSNETPVRRMSGQRGVIVGIGGRVLGLELFGSQRALANRWDGLVNAAMLDARTAPRIPTPAQAARDFVVAVASVPLRDAEIAGLATGVRSDRGSLRSIGLRMPNALSGSLLHLAAFDDSHPVLVGA